MLPVWIDWCVQDTGLKPSQLACISPLYNLPLLHGRWKSLEWLASKPVASIEVGGGLQSEHNMHVHCITSSQEGRTDILDETQTRRTIGNLTKPERKAMPSLILMTSLHNGHTKTFQTMYWRNQSVPFHKEFTAKWLDKFVTFLDVRITSENAWLIRNLYTSQQYRQIKSWVK